MEMAEEDFISYKDISELKKDFEGMKSKKEISVKELYDVVQKMADTMNGMLEVFGAAAEQMKLEDKEHDSGSRKHDAIISKLDKIIDQNKTIAEAMLGVVDMIKEKVIEKESMFKPEPLFKPKPFPETVFTRPQQEWQPKPEPMQRTQPLLVPPPMTFTRSFLRSFFAISSTL